MPAVRSWCWVGSAGNDDCDSWGTDSTDYAVSQDEDFQEIENKDVSGEGLDVILMWIL